MIIFAKYNYVAIEGKTDSCKCLKGSFKMLLNFAETSVRPYVRRKKFLVFSFLPVYGVAEIRHKLEVWHKCLHVYEIRCTVFGAYYRIQGCKEVSQYNSAYGWEFFEISFDIAILHKI